jgi:hypothetical protein
MNDHHDDELTRRFRAVFNKEPVSQATKESAWEANTQGEYEVDDEEVKISSGNPLADCTSSEG